MAVEVGGGVSVGVGCIVGEEGTIFAGAVWVGARVGEGVIVNVVVIVSDITNGYVFFGWREDTTM